MLSIKEYNKKLVSLKNTRKMTKTMKMVSASKFKRAFKAQSSALMYAQKLQALMARLSASGVGSEHALFKKKKAVNNVLIFVITSDKGLCGGFNNGLIRFVRHWLTDHANTYKKVSFSFAGRKGYFALRRQVETVHYYEQVTVRPTFEQAISITQDLVKAFVSGEYDEVYIAYNNFKGPMSQVPVMEMILPLDPKALVPATGAPLATSPVEYEVEPSSSELLASMIDKFLNFKVFFCLLENAAGEHGARMTAMDKASSNTADLIDRFTLMRNRARQAAITTELIEIISGAEALK